MSDKSKKRAKGLASRTRKMGERSRKRENAFADLLKRTDRLGKTAFSVDEKLFGEIRRLERQLKGGVLPKPKKERGI